MLRIILSMAISILLLITSIPSQILAQKRILVLGWNVESGDNAPSTIAYQLEKFEGYDIIGLTEVVLDNAAGYADAAGVGEGAKDTSQTDFRYITGTTGGSDRMVIIWDNRRFKKVGDKQELHDINSSNKKHRSPLFTHFKLRGTDVKFLFMVNHLARGNASLRQEQGDKLKDWAEDQSLPVIAVGDYNFDYDIDDGEGNQAMENMLEDDVWQWVRPPRLYKTQFSKKYYSVLDFIFIAGKPRTWSVDSRILTKGFPAVDDNRRSDHRPMELRVLINQ